MAIQTIQNRDLSDDSTDAPKLEDWHFESQTTICGSASESCPDESPHSMDPDYLVEEFLGAGLQGSVTRGVNKKTGSRVAIKRISRDAACPIRFLEMHGEDGATVHVEGYAAVGCVARTLSAPLAFNEVDPYGSEPCPSELCAGCFLVVLRGGGVPFAQKASNALSGRARGLLVVNNADTTESFTVAGVAISAFMIPWSDGQEVLAMLRSGRVSTVVRTDAEQEAAIICSLPPHPHIIRYYDSWEDGNTMVLTMQLCSGGQLKENIGFADAKRMTQQMVDAVRHLHAHGICHRDLKLSNFLLTAPLDDLEAKLVLIDFSMATRAKRVSLCCGSVPYLAPEVLKGSYGQERDVWSIGVIVHQLVIGSLPFKNTTHEAILEWLELPDEVEFNTEDWMSIPNEAKLFVQGLLQKDPAKRLTLEEAACHPWLQN